MFDYPENSNSFKITLPQGKNHEVSEAAFEYLENKYGEKFEYAAPWGDSMSNTKEILVTCESFPGQLIIVQVEDYQKSGEQFRDNYLAVKYQQQSTDFFNECAEKVFGEANAFFTPIKDGLSPNLPADATFEEFLADKRVKLVIYIEVKESTFEGESQAEELSRLIGNYGSHYLLEIILVNEENYGSYDDVTALKDVLRNKKYIRCLAVDNSSGTVKMARFGE